MNTTTPTEKRITGIRPTGQPEKRSYPFATSWFMPVEYTLDDGTTQPGTVGPYTRKRDAIAGNAERDDITNMVANYEAGRFIGTTTTYGLR